MTDKDQLDALADETELAEIKNNSSEAQHIKQRRLEVARWYFRGLAREEIAKKVGCSVRTVGRDIDEWDLEREKATRIDKVELNAVISEVRKEKEAAAEFERVLSEGNIHQLPNGTWAHDVEVRVPKGVRPWGIMPPAPGVKRLCIDSKYIIRRILSEKDISELKLGM